MYLIEPNPLLATRLRKNFRKAYVGNFAIMSKDKTECTFNIVKSRNKAEVGCSSLLERIDEWGKHIKVKQNVIRVPSVTGLSLLDKITTPVDLCIIDVEGLSYEVVNSFGSKLHMIKSLMIECEHKKLFKNQKLFSSVSRLLVKNDFCLMAFKYAYSNQSDSVWIQRDFVNLDISADLKLV